MTTLYLHHPSTLGHQPAPGHPERPDRIRAIERAVADERFAALHREEAPKAGLETVELAHPEAYAKAIVGAAPSQGLVYLDGDTGMSPGTLEAALRGVGAAVQA